MRLEGSSIKEIEASLAVARSSVSRWVRDVELGPEQRERLLARARLGPLVAAERSAARARQTRLGYQLEGRRLARMCDPTYVAGCMLYWAEGSKSRNAVRLTNSDPDLVAYFVAFLRTHFDVPNDRLRLACNLFSDHEPHQHRVESFWLHRLDLQRDSPRATTINHYSKYSLKRRTNKLPYGTAAVSVYSTRIAQMLYGSIQELGRFERPEWLG